MSEPLQATEELAKRIEVRFACGVRRVRGDCDHVRCEAAMEIAQYVRAAALAGEGSPVSPADQKGPHIAAVEYARSYVVPLYRNGEEGTPYERGMVRSVAQHWLAGYFAAKPPNESEPVSLDRVRVVETHERTGVQREYEKPAVSPAGLKPEEVPAWVQIRAGSELTELISLIRFAPGQPTAFLHSEHDANGLLWRWALKWAPHMRASSSAPAAGEGLQEKRANALRDAVCRTLSMGTVGVDRIEQSLKAALMADNELCDRIHAPRRDADTEAAK